MVRLEHVGIAVQDIGKVAHLYQILMNLVPYKHEEVIREGVRTTFLSAGETKLELLESLGEQSPVGRFLEKRGPGIHHLAFEVDDIDDTFARAQAAQFTTLSATPLPGADNKRIFFLHPRETAGVLVEFCQSVQPDLEIETWSGGGTPFVLYRTSQNRLPQVLVLPPDPGPGGSVAAFCSPILTSFETRFSVSVLGRIPDNQADASEPVTLKNVLDVTGSDSVSIVAMGSGVNLLIPALRENDKRIARLVLHQPRFDAGLDEDQPIHLQTLLSFSSDFPSIPLETIPAFRSSFVDSQLVMFPGAGDMIGAEILPVFRSLLFSMIS